MGKVGSIIVKAAIGIALTAATGGFTGFAAGGTMAGIFGTSAFAQAAVMFVGSVVLGFAAEAFAPKLEEPSLAGFNQQALGGIVRQFQSPVESWKWIVGEMRVSGPTVFVESTDDNKFLHLVTVIAPHRVESIDYAIIAENPIYPDELTSSGVVNIGDYKGKVRFKFRVGSSEQTAESALVDEVPQWTSDHRLLGRAYMYTRLEYDRDTFPTGIPALSTWTKGKKHVDVRTASTRWTTNPQLAIRDYVSAPVLEGGMGFDVTNDIDGAFSISASNACDEIVTTQNVTTSVTSVNTLTDRVVLSGDIIKYITGDQVQISSTGSIPAGLSASTNYYAIINKRKKTATSSLEMSFASTYINALAGTAINITSEGSGTIKVIKNGEPRYTCNGRIDTSRRTGENLDELLGSMGGRASHIGPSWKFYAGVAQTPTLLYNETDIIGELVVRTKHPRRSRFNAVKGTYISPLNNGIVSGYPSVVNSTYLTEDGGEQIFRTLNLAFTNRPHTAERIAKIELERHRQQITTTATMQLTAFKDQPGGVIQLDNTRFGWSAKEFEIADMTFSTVDSNTGSGESGEGVAPVFVVGWTLREHAASNFDWNSGEETLVDPAPDTNLPDPFAVGSPTGLTLDSGADVLDIAQDGTIISRIKLNWLEPSDSFLRSYEVAYKKSSASRWITVTFDAPQTEYFINSVEDGIDYDVAVRAVNQFGRRSDTNNTPSTWSAYVAEHRVIGKTEPPATPTSFYINDDLLSWTGPEAELDLDGYLIKFHYGENADWATGTLVHTGVLKASPYKLEVRPQDLVTLMLKSVDTTGNESPEAATIVVNLGDPIVANVVESFAQDPTWPGTKTNCSVVSTDLVADLVDVIMWSVTDTDLMWDADDSVLMWETLTYEEMTYVFTFIPSAVAAGSNLTIEHTLIGLPIEITYFVEDELMWSVTDTDLMWDADDTLMMWVNKSFTAEGLPWPGAIIAENIPYTIRLVIGGGITQGVASIVTPQIDVPDLEESLADVVLGAGGSRLSLTEDFTVISTVTITLQDDGGSAHTAMGQDKNVALGPLVQAFNTAGSGVTGTVDVIVRGY